MIISRWVLALKGKWSLSSPGRASSKTAELQIAPSGKTQGREANGSRNLPGNLQSPQHEAGKLYFPSFNSVKKPGTMEGQTFSP